MRVIITEEQFNFFLKEMKINEALIDEDQESKSIDAAKDLLTKRLGWAKEHADKFIRLRLRNLFPNLKTKNGGKFILGTTRLYLDGELNEDKSISSYNTILKYLSSDEFNGSFNRNLNNLHLSELINYFSERINSDLNNDKAKLSKREYTPNKNYKIVPIYSFEDAAKYSPFCSWCITKTEMAFNQYSNNGLSQFYFCLRNDYKTTPKVVEKNAPLDNYGLSMIAVCVNNSGLLESCTTRWNDKNGGTMNAMTTQDLTDLIGQNFYTIFKPTTAWNEDLKTVESRLENGEDLKEIFEKYELLDNGIYIVYLYNKVNYMNQNNELLSSEWFDFGSNFNDGFAIVSLSNKWNFIDKNGTFLLKDNVAHAEPFKDGVALIENDNEQFNFINKEGNLISKKWFDLAYDFDKNKTYTLVTYKSLFNFINRNGDFLLKEPAIWARKMDNEFYYIRTKSGKYNFVNKQGELISKEWFDWAGSFKNGIAPVEIKHKTYSINEFGEIKSSIKEEKETIYYIDPQKVLIVSKFLNKNFKKGTMSKISDDGYPITEKIIGLKDSNGNIVKNFYPEQLYDLLDDKFHYIYTDPNKRMRFIKKIINDWMNNKISREGLLSTNSF